MSLLSSDDEDDLHGASRSPPSFKLVHQSTPSRKLKDVDELDSLLADDESQTHSRFRQSRAPHSKAWSRPSARIPPLTRPLARLPLEHQQQMGEAMSTSSSTLVDREETGPGVKRKGKRAASPRAPSPTSTIVPDRFQLYRAAPPRRPVSPDVEEATMALSASGNAAARVRDVFARVIRSPPIPSSSSMVGITLDDGIGDTNTRTPARRPTSAPLRNTSDARRRVSTSQPRPLSPLLSEDEEEVVPTTARTPRPPGHLSFYDRSEREVEEVESRPVKAPPTEDRQVRFQAATIPTPIRRSPGRSEGARRTDVVERRIQTTAGTSDRGTALVNELLDHLRPDVPSAIAKPSIRDVFATHRPRRISIDAGEAARASGTRQLGLQEELDRAGRIEQALLARIEDIRASADEVASSLGGKVSHALNDGSPREVGKRRGWLLFAFAVESVLFWLLTKAVRHRADSAYQGSYLDPFSPSLLSSQAWPAEVFGPAVLPETVLLFGTPCLGWQRFLTLPWSALSYLNEPSIRPLLRVPV